MRFTQRIATGLLTLAACGFLAGGAMAMDGGCLWNSLPVAKQKSLLDSYRDRGIDAMGDMNFSDAELIGFPKCGVTEANADKAGEILGSLLLEKGSDAYLFEQFDIKTGTLDAAWKALSPADRKALKTYGLAMMEENDEVKNLPAEKVLSTAQAVADRLNLSDPAALAQITMFMMGRSIREAREAE